MKRPRPEPVQIVKQRRDAALKSLVEHIPYINYMGISFDRRGDELTAIMPFRDDLIGNPLLPALHGGTTAGLLEVTALVGLAWSSLWEDMESGAFTVEQIENKELPPPTIKVPVAVATGVSSSLSSATARTNATLRVM